MTKQTTTYEKIYAAVRKIRRGQVATYGQIAAIAGIPRQARRVGYALSALDEHSDVPWQRVINAQGEISERPFADLQKDLLKKEGIVFSKEGRVDLARFQWKP
ncbi:MAG: MGMT family protein [Candidatus Omnitrophota bacterium]